MLNDAWFKQKEKWHTWLFDLVFLLVPLIVFYFVRLGHWPLFTPDEARYSEVAREMLTTHQFLVPRMEGIPFLDKPILYYWLQVLALYLFGIKEWALRLFPALCGILGIAMVYVHGRLLFTRTTAWLAAIILATVPLYFVSAHYADLSMEVATLISSSLLCFLTATATNSSTTQHSWLFLSYFFAALAILTKGLIGLAFPLIIIGAWALLLKRCTRTIKENHIILGLLLIAALVLPWYVFVQQAEPSFFRYFFLEQQLQRFLSVQVFNNPGPFWFYVPVIVLGFFPWSIFLCQAIMRAIALVRQNSVLYQIELFLLLWSLIIVLFFSIPHSKSVGYILPIFPPLALLVGKYLTDCWQKNWGPMALCTYGACFFLGTLLLTGLFLLWMQHSHTWSSWLRPAFAHYFVTLLLFTSISGAGVLIGCMIAILLSFKKATAVFFTLCVGWSVTILVVLLLGAGSINNHSSKSLALYLKTIIQPQDEVATYEIFPQDFPLYLGRPITIVANWQDVHLTEHDNWQRELYYGMQIEHNYQWLQGEGDFWQNWRSNKQVFVLLHANRLQEFTSHTNHYIYLAQKDHFILLSNHLLTTSSLKVVPFA